MTRGLLKVFEKMFTSMLHDRANAFAVKDFASEIKQIDQLIEHLEDGTGPAYLQPLFEEIDHILGQLYAIYLNELQFLAAGEPQNVAANQIARDFTEVRPVIARLRNELSGGEGERCLDTARELKTVVGKLFNSFADLRSQARQGPRYSELPFTQELLRVVHHYLAGNLGVNAVQERLDAFCNYHDNLELSFEQMIPTAAEAPIMEARQDDLEEALGLQLQGIEDLDVALERRSDKAILQAAESLRVAAETLHEIYLELQAAENEPETVSCFRCGASNQADQRLCSGCGAVLPRFDASDKRVPSIEIKEGANALGGSKPDELLKLERAVDQALRSGDRSGLQQALDGFETRLRGVEKRLDGLKEPPADIPADHLDLLREGRSRFEEAMEILAEGHSILRDGAEGLDANTLRRGLDEVEAGYQSLLDFGELYEQAEKVSPAPGKRP